MNSIDGFREGEIDGKPFHIFNFLSQTQNLSSSSEAAIDSGGDDLLDPPRQHLFMCQKFSSIYGGRFGWNHGPNWDDFVPVDVNPYTHEFCDEISGDDSRYGPCKLPLAPLFWCNNQKPNNTEFFCYVCETGELGTDYYLCVDKCGWKYHKECIECPLEIKHPSYPFLSLKLYYTPPNRLGTLSCFCCQTDVLRMFYYCPTYKLALHPVCAVKPIPILIDHPKRHPHTLTFFPKQNSLACNVCGLIENLIPTYVCARCVFVVHQYCIYHPYVIKICRHHHRISFTYSLPSGEFSCGVCRRKVDNSYGAYSCNKCDGYFVHTRCALRKDLWDGKELEGVPEEPEIVLEPPFKRISNGIILHFSHDHHLKIQIGGVYDEGKICQACILPIYEGSYYSCVDQCGFILHQDCASAPREKQHALHALSLKLKVVTDDNVREDYFSCHACLRKNCGFFYEGCITSGSPFRLDLRCAWVAEPFEYEGHEHPLYLALTPEEEESALCQICQEKGDKNNDCKKLNCIECNFIICFACATLPYKVRYTHDKHFLTFREKEVGNDHPGWCDICESKLVFSSKGGFYSCDEYCSTTLHVNCLLGGEDMYLMKPGQTIMLFSTPRKVTTLGNKTMSRPFCHGQKHFRKEHHCPHKVVFKVRNMTFCSFDCSFKFYFRD